MCQKIQEIDPCENVMMSMNFEDIRKDKGFGFGTKAYAHFENEMRKRGLNKV